jgi:hypothetical protein
VGGRAAQPIVIGTGAGDVETLAQLQMAVENLSGVIGTVNTSNGDTLQSPIAACRNIRIV